MKRLLRSEGFRTCRLLVFARAPAAGRVKTRLQRVLGAEGAAELHRRLVWRTLKVATGTGWPVELWCHPTPGDPFFVGCREAFGVELREQEGRDLGERMLGAMAHGLRGARAAVLVGSDCPVLEAVHFEAAVSALAGGTDVVIGPAEDGGYVLLGLGRMVPELFGDMPWGSALVLTETRRRLRTVGLRWTELPALWDVDRPGDLERLRSVGWPAPCALALARGVTSG